jgi:hypothetical protein
MNGRSIIDNNDIDFRRLPLPLAVRPASRRRRSLRRNTRHRLPRMTEKLLVSNILQQAEILNIVPT